MSQTPFIKGIVEALQFRLIERQVWIQKCGEQSVLILPRTPE